MSRQDATEHPTDELLAAFVEGTLTEVERISVLEHIDECSECRKGLEIARGVLSDLTPSRRRVPWPVPAAAAAAVLATLFLLPSGPEPIERAGAPEGIPTFEIVSPQDGQVVSAAPSIFVWRPAEGGATYELVVTDQAGAPVWSVRTADTMAVLPGDVLLSPGQYYWLVDALLDRGREATTGVRTFRVRE